MNRTAARGRRHPFAMSSPPSERHIDLTVKAAGDYTRADLGRGTRTVGRRTTYRLRARDV